MHNVAKENLLNYAINTKQCTIHKEKITDKLSFKSIPVKINVNNYQVPLISAVEKPVSQRLLYRPSRG